MEPEAEPWCGADRAVVNLAWHDIQLVELVPAFCSSFGASHFPICISGPEPDVRRELHGTYRKPRLTWSQDTAVSHSVSSCSSPPAHLLQLSLQLCTAPTVLSSDMTSEYVYAFKKTTGRPSRDIRMSGPVRFVVDGFRTGIPVTDLPWHGMPSQPM